MSIRDEPHYTVGSTELAAWIERQGLDRWWTVDGDPRLTSRLSLPCPGDDLAAELRRINRRLLLLDPHKNPEAHGQRVGTGDLDSLASRFGDNVEVQGAKPPWMDDRLFCFSWEDSDIEWLLIEDGETTQRSREDAAAAAQGKP